MLARKYRLNESDDIERVKESGKTFRSNSFTVKHLKNPKSDVTRTAFIVSNNVSKNSSIRHKVKRALDEGVRQSLYAVKPGNDLVFIANTSSVKAYTSDLMNEVKEVLTKIGIMK